MSFRLAPFNTTIPLCTCKPCRSVSIVLSSEIEVALIYPPLAFVTSEEMQDYAQNTCKPLFLSMAQEQVDKHNVDPDAHMNIRNHVESNDDRIRALENFLGGSTSASFREDFVTLDGVVLDAGIYNEPLSRVEF